MGLLRGSGNVMTDVQIYYESSWLDASDCVMFLFVLGAACISFAVKPVPLCAGMCDAAMCTFT